MITRDVDEGHIRVGLGCPVGIFLKVIGRRKDDLGSLGDHIFHCLLEGGLGAVSRVQLVQVHKAGIG